MSSTDKAKGCIPANDTSVRNYAISILEEKRKLYAERSAYWDMRVEEVMAATRREEFVDPEHYRRLARVAAAAADNLAWCKSVQPPKLRVIQGGKSDPVQSARTPSRR